ncbi:MAG: hypothetical protein K2N47_05715 [Clostridia bacterium]|nr:hypothetical protein [Clostridia bacterium]
MARGGSKAVTAVISFILGFLFAIIVEVGAIFGVYVFVTSQDIDTILGMVGLENTTADGEHKYINTTEAKTLKDLISAIQNLLYDEEGGFALLSKSIGDIKNLVPATGILLDTLYSFIGDYIDLDHDKFENTEFTELMTVIMESIYDVKTATVLVKFNVTDVTAPDANIIVKSLLMGVEAEYASVNYGVYSEDNFTLPVFYDTYTKEDDITQKYFRTVPVENGDEVYPDALSTDFLQPTTMTNAGGETIYKLYYVPCKIGDGIEEADYSMVDVDEEMSDGTTRSYTVVNYGEDTVFIAVIPDGEGKFTIQAADVVANHEAYEYSQNYARHYYDFTNDVFSTIHGINFFRDNAGKIIQTNGLTLRNILENPFTPLDNIKVVSIMDNEQARDIFKDLTLGAMMRGEFDFNEMVDEMPLSNFVTNVSTSDKLMAYLVYKLSDITPTGGGFTATYDKGGPNQKVGVTVNVNGSGFVTGASANGEKLKGTLVKEISTISKSVSLSVIMDIRADDPIMLYLGYGATNAYQKSGTLTNVYQNDGNNTELTFNYDYVGTYNRDDGNGNFTEYPCYISTTANGDVDVIWYCVDDDYDRYEKVTPVSVNEVSSRIGSITDMLALPDVMDISLSGDSTLMAHIAYGISSVKAEAGSGYTHTATFEVGGQSVKCYISTQVIDGDTVIKDVWYMDGADRIPVKGVKIADLANSLESLKVKDIFTEDEINANPMLKQLKNKNVTELDKAIDEMLIQTIYSKEVYGLPEDKDPMEVVEFNADWTYFVSEKQADNTFKLVQANVTAADMTDGRVYYTYGDNTTTYDPDRPLKIVGFVGGSYRTEWLYFTLDEGGEFDLVHNNASDPDLRGNLTDAEAASFTAGKYYSYGEAQGMWRLVLYKDTIEKAYTINNFNNMVASCAANVYNSKLYDLQKAGIIDKDKNLSKSFGGKELGDMTLEELINMVLALP